ncbi:MAG: hypothetical protein GXP55_17480 [Deltaproteobacteria bacterium]|nr:hypothetical protein [Deltaproteobacteria bacterium]
MRIHCRLDLGEAAPEGTVKYIDVRMQASGAKHSPFDSDALTMLHRATLERLCDIDHIASECLERAARRKFKRVDAPLVQNVAKDCA